MGRRKDFLRIYLFVFNEVYLYFDFDERKEQKGFTSPQIIDNRNINYLENY